MQSQFFRALISIAIAFLFVQFPFAQESQEKLDFAYGERLYREGLFDLSSIQFQNYIQAFPSSPRVSQAQWMVSESFYKSQKFEDARREYLRYILDYPAGADLDNAQFMISQCFENTGKMVEAAQSYYQVYAIYPQSKWVGASLYRVASIFFGLDSLHKAEAALRLLLDLKIPPEFVSKATFLFSELFVRQGMYDSAIRLLTPFTNRPPRDADFAQAEFRLGKIHEAVGDWTQAFTHYQSAANSAGQEEIRQDAWLRLGRMNNLLDNTNEALKDYQQCIILNKNGDLTVLALFHTGKTEYALGHFQAALEAFDKIDSQNTDSLHTQILLVKAQALEAVGRSQDAASLYQSMLNDSSGTVRKTAVLSLAGLFYKKGEYELAFRQYDGFLKAFPTDALSDKVGMRQAELAFGPLSRFEEGFSSLQRIWKDFPGSPAIPEATYRYGRGLERVNRYEEAVLLYARIEQEHPFSAWADSARARREFIRMFVPSSGPKFIQSVSRFLERTSSNPTASIRHYDLGMFLFKDSKQYDDAAKILKEWTADSPDSARLDSALYCIGESFNRMSFDESNTDLVDSADAYFAKLINRFPDSPLTVKAKIKTAFNFLSKNAASPFPYGLDRDFAADTSAETESLLFDLAHAEVKCDSLNAALTLLGRMQRDFPDGRCVRQVRFLKASIYFKIGMFAVADSLFESFRMRYPGSSMLADVSWLQGLIALKRGNANDAVVHLDAAWNGRPTLVEPDSLLLTLGGARLKTGYPADAALAFGRALTADSVLLAAERFDLIQKRASKRKRILLGLAESCAGLNELQRAKRLYLQYGEENPDPSTRFFVWSSLSRLAESEGKPDQALFFLKKNVESSPSDSAYRSLGLMHFRLGNYSESIPALSKALESVSSAPERAFLQSKIIVSTFRLDKILEGEAMIKPFEKQFKNLPDYRDNNAEIELEWGKAYSRDKSFDLAIKHLKEAQDNKKSSYAVEAEFEIGRIYLMTNKTDKALELLTDMIKKYPGHPVIPRIYLNLGDQYYRSNQLDNALVSFKKAAGDSLDPDVAALAQRYLIKVYEGFQMVDAALALSKAYIRRFPNAEDVFQKRIQIGIYYYELKEFQRAIDQFFAIKPTADSESDAEIQYWIGKCYFDMGQFERAVFEYLKVKYVSPPTKLPWASTALYEAGLAYIRMQKPSTARRMFEKIMQSEGAASDLGRIARQKIADIDAGKTETAAY